jgi:iron(III) transport system ATP-binding protein
MSGVAVAGLCKSFGARRVLDRLDLEVPEGSLTAVLGPSGSGKTTLLRVIAGFERADSGRVELAGSVVEDRRVHVAPERRRVGYVPQDGALFPHLTVAENVGFGLSRGERSGPRVVELLAMVGLSGEGGRLPHQLSGGMQQRVALARALAVRPALVLLDEPFGALDASMRAELRDDVRRALQATGATAVLVTHDQDEALSLADRVAVLRDGRVAQAATPQELYARPLDPAMAGFVGDANLVPGVLREGRAVTPLGRLTLLGGSGAGLTEGEALLVLVRPERVEVGEAGAAGGIRGTVVESRYYGHDVDVLVEVEGGMRMRARTVGGTPLEVGTVVSLRSAAPVVAWPAGSEAQGRQLPGAGGDSTLRARLGATRGGSPGIFG